MVNLLGVDAWLLIGDLNEVLCQFEREGGSDWSTARRNYMKEVMKGQCFTWARKENGVIVLQERLDRSLVNESWLLWWPESSLTHLACIGSDHNPLLFNTNLVTKKGRPMFRFDVNWVDDVEAKQLVEECWSMTPGLTNLANWTSCLSRCRSKFRS